MEQLMEEKKYFYEIFSVILPENIIKEIIIKTISDKEIEKYVDEKIVEFINKHLEEQSENDKMTKSKIDNFDLINITMDQLRNDSWYIIKDPQINNYMNYTVIIYYNVYGIDHSLHIQFGLYTIRNFLKINETKIIKNDLEQYLI